MTNRIQAAIIPPISKELYDQVVAAFRDEPVKDSDTLIQIGRNAGRQEVIRFLRRYVNERVISGNIEDITPKQKLSFFQRLFRS